MNKCFILWSLRKQKSKPQKDKCFLPIRSLALTNTTLKTTSIETDVSQRLSHMNDEKVKCPSAERKLGDSEMAE